LNNLLYSRVLSLRRQQQQRSFPSGEPAITVAKHQITKKDEKNIVGNMHASSVLIFNTFDLNLILSFFLCIDQRDQLIFGEIF